MTAKKEQQKYSIKEVELFSNLPDLNREPRFLVKVASNKKITKEVLVLSLERPTDFKFKPGQYIWLVLPDLTKYYGVIDRRAYSISSGIENETIDLTINITNSDYLSKVKALKVNEEVYIIGPMGSAFDIPPSGAIMIAGGTGIAPFLSALRSHASDNLTLIAYSRKEKESLHFETELAELADKYGYKIHLIKSGPQISDFKCLTGNKHIEPILISGSQGFVDFVTNLLRECKINPKRLHYEEFYPSTEITKNLHNSFKEFFFGDWSNNPQKLPGLSNLFLEVVKQSHNYVILTDHNGRILFANQSAVDLSGYSFIEMQGQTPRLWGGLMSPNSYREKWNILKKGGSVKRMSINRRRDGTIYTSITTITPIIREGIFMATEENVTTLRDVDRSKTEFVSIASHQLRTPLSAIRWYIEMLLAGDAGKLSDKQREYMDEVYTSTARMVELVNALLDASRLELGTFSVSNETIDIVQLANDIMSEQKISALQKKLDISISTDTEIPKIQSDLKSLRMVMQNLLSNSIKYTPENGKIKISFSIFKSNNILIKISDNGYGIPKPQQDRIFTKFFRADNVRLKSTEGTGLGLYIVKLIIDNYGGRIRFESEENKGTTFYITIPIKNSANKDKETGVIL